MLTKAFVSISIQWRESAIVHSFGGLCILGNTCTRTILINHKPLKWLAIVLDAYMGSKEDG
jgi:hypothetical protein